MNSSLTDPLKMENSASPLAIPISANLKCPFSPNNLEVKDFSSLNTNASWRPFMSHFRSFFSLPEESWESENLYPSGDWSGRHVQNGYCLSPLVLFSTCTWLKRLDMQAHHITTPPIWSVLPSGSKLLVPLLSENPDLPIFSLSSGYFLFFFYLFFLL